MESVEDSREVLAGGDLICSRFCNYYLSRNIYLAGCAYGFADGWMNVYQVLGSHAENTVGEPLPLTREYMYVS